MKLEAFIFSMRSSVKKSKDKSRFFLYKQDKTILSLLRNHSPVDSGTFNSNWNTYRARFGARNVLAGLLITNDTPYYGKFIAFGAEPKKAPWYYPHGKKVSTGKLTLAEGKVWAGGLSPGHGKTIGGPIVQVMDKFANDFVQKYADEIAKDLL